MKRDHGFSFVELLVTIAMILILLSLISTALTMALEKAKRVSSINNLKRIGIALTLYSSEDPIGSYPNDGINNANGTTAGSLWLLDDSIKITGTLLDPSSGRAPSPSWAPDMSCDFVYLHTSMSSLMSPDSGIVANHVGTHTNYGSILYAGGYVIGNPGADWNSNLNVKNSELQILTN